MESFHGGKIYIMINASVGKPNSFLSISHWRNTTDSFEAFPILSFSTLFQNWASYPDFLFDFLGKKSELKDYYSVLVSFSYSVYYAVDNLPVCYFPCNVGFEGVTNWR